MKSSADVNSQADGELAETITDKLSWCMSQVACTWGSCDSIHEIILAAFGQTNISCDLCAVFVGQSQTIHDNS